MMKRGMFVVGAIVLVGCGGNGGAGAKDPSGPAESGPRTEKKEPASTASGSSGATSTASTTSGEAGPHDLSDLELKRRVDSINERIPKHKAKFKELCETEVAVDIDWSSFGRDKATIENLASNYGVERLVMSFAPICRDKAGKDAVKSKVKSIKLVNVKEKDKVKVNLAGGTVSAWLNWSSGGAPGKNESEIAAEITKGL